MFGRFPTILNRFAESVSLALIMQFNVNYGCHGHLPIVCVLSATGIV
ncbi:Uncharacterized protein FWK35_00021958 [Aphis craccivora]|uniref:Uncharacterized protein n=1 Tax=Aphis craccivora TaxID=307492 RepID=A0A6G0Y669_APHCR|nr:Uncharacterized protein FWK35_00021958 [Aphis craccivora]